MSGEQGVFSGVTNTVGGVTDTVGGIAGKATGNNNNQQEEEYKMTPDQQAQAKESQEKGRQGVEPIKEGEDDAKIAKRLAAIVDRGLERIEPLLKMMNESIDDVNKKREKKENIDEKAFVDRMKPLIQEASQILNETLGGLKGADPDGKIQSRAQHKKANHEASPEENHLAESVSKLTGDVAKTIEKAKASIKDLPKAKKDLGPLLAILNDPLFQILSAVGLLLKGVLGLVANILGALHLDGLVKGLLGGLGLDKLLDSLGLGDIFTKKN
ncbi:hypothetical protein M422DRAFT_238454 [Sphaerobolus stellatus SS14]|nr:hypothetical protein M422DRAFT_238454 [Sphaerobolus stellatus SS14]